MWFTFQKFPLTFLVSVKITVGILPHPYLRLSLTRSRFFEFFSSHRFRFWITFETRYAYSNTSFSKTMKRICMIFVSKWRWDFTVSLFAENKLHLFARWPRKLKMKWKTLLGSVFKTDPEPVHKGPTLLSLPPRQNTEMSKMTFFMSFFDIFWLF